MRTAVGAAVGLGLVVSAGQAIAAQAASAPQTLDEVVVVGARTPGRLALESPAPVDVISGETLRTQGFTDLSRALQFLAPSFNYPRGATAPSSANTRAVSLRGLSPDQVLVLIDGKRLHSSSVINFNNVYGRGSTPTDLNAIPLSAVARVEILRDGAAAQYGSDAIAGVINIVLRRDLEGSAIVQTGVTEAGGGDNTTASITKGYAFAGDRGRVTLTGEARYRNSSNRAKPDARFGRITGEQGDPDSLDLNGAAVASFALREGLEAYANAIYDHRASVSPAQYRAPTIAPALYPLGFVPHIRVDLNEATGTAGLRGAAPGGWTFDLSNTFGYSRAGFKVRDTANTTLGAASPRIFEAGDTRYLQNVLGLNATHAFRILQGATLTVGAEHRFESFAIGPGEFNSYTGAGAQGFPGLNPPIKVDAERNAVAVYADAELKPLKGLTLGGAVRQEHYDDFGDATSGKVSLFYKPSPYAALRATASTGFRAPSLQQNFFSTVTSQSTAGVLVNVGTFAVSDPVSRALGAAPLRPETSTNFSGGIVLTPAPGFALTADVFHIEIDDRVALSETLTGAAVTNVLRAAGVTNASQARFFTNAADTVTDGFEVTGTWRGRLGEAVRYDVAAGYAAFDTDVSRLRGNPVLPALPLLGASSIDLLTKAQPRNKATLSGRLDWRAWTVSAEVVRFGAFRAISVLAEQTFAAKTTLDVTVDYAVTSRVRVGFGVINLGDEFPDRIADRALSQGGSLAYPEVGGLGTNGREYFARVAARF